VKYITPLLLLYVTSHAGSDCQAHSINKKEPCKVDVLDTIKHYVHQVDTVSTTTYERDIVVKLTEVELPDPMVLVNKVDWAKLQRKFNSATKTFLETD
jgi:hypothetical protein